MRSYYVLIEPWGTYVKEAEFFKFQGGDKEPWGKKWVHIRADSIEHARAKGDLIRGRNKK